MRSFVIFGAFVVLSAPPAKAQTGACCFFDDPTGDLTCEDRAAEDCQGEEFVFGEGSSCADENGICCGPFGSCQEQMSICECLMYDEGAFYNTITDECLNLDSCSVGACCGADGTSCDVKPQALCEDEGGTFVGVGADCDAFQCPSGACCTDTCTVMTAHECATAGGTFGGVKSSCLSSFIDCTSGPADFIEPGCECADLNDDGHVDLLDYAVLQIYGF